MNHEDSGPDISQPPPQFPAPLTIKDVLARLPCGRGWLLAHLRAWPVYHGRPTHRFAGRKIVFTPQDYEVLMQSLPIRTSASAPRVPHSEPASWVQAQMPARKPMIGRRGKRDHLKPKPNVD